MGAYGIVSDNLYSQVRVFTDPAEDSRLLVINNSPSSKIAAHPEHRFAYFKFLDQESSGARPGSAAAHPRDRGGGSPSAWRIALMPTRMSTSTLLCGR